jgi:hypothetical protein
MPLRKALLARYQSGHDTIIEENSLLGAALYYFSKGWSVIPLRGKQSTVAWKKFEDTRAERGQVCEWFLSDAPTGVGIVTGAISNMFVLDVDPKNGGQESLGRLQMKYGTLPDTLRVRTGGGGQHFYFCMPQGVEVRNAADLQGYLGLDIRGNGGYVAAPPSKHPSGKRYKWDTSGAEEPVEAPQWLVDLVKEDRPQGDSSTTAVSLQQAKIEPMGGARLPPVSGVRFETAQRGSCSRSRVTTSERRLRSFS